MIADAHQRHVIDVDQAEPREQFAGVVLDLLHARNVGGRCRTQRYRHDAIDPCSAVKNRIASGPSRSTLSGSTMWTRR